MTGTRLNCYINFTPGKTCLVTVPTVPLTDKTVMTSEIRREDPSLSLTVHVGKPVYSTE